MKKAILISIILALTLNLSAQDESSNNTNFMIRGYGSASFTSLNEGGENVTSFNNGSFSPIFLFKMSDKLMFEAEMEFQYSGSELDIVLEYANVMYLLNDYVTVRAGKFILPYGTFMEKLHPSWVNKMSTAPLGFGHHGIMPSTGVGVELRGAFGVRGSKFNYSLYSTNGPKLNDGSGDSEGAGMVSYDNYKDNNNSKSFGGRIGFLPFMDSSTELGFSFLNSKVGDAGSHYEDVGANMIAYDFSFIKNVVPFSGIIDIKAQYNNITIDSAEYFKVAGGDHGDDHGDEGDDHGDEGDDHGDEGDDHGDEEDDHGDEEDDHGDEEEGYTFKNKSSSFYVQVSYRPSMFENNLLKNLEFVGRYSGSNTPMGSEWASSVRQKTFGINYWLKWNSVIKLNYQITDGVGGHGGGPIAKELFTVQWAFGL